MAKARNSSAAWLDRESIIFGGSGFIGSALRRQFAATASPVTILSREPAPVDRFGNERWIQGDFKNSDMVAGLLSPAMDVYHLVSSSIPAQGNWDVEADVHDIVLPTLALLKAAVRSQVRRVIYVSSGGTVYGQPTQLPIPESAPTNPISAYGIGKLTMEKYLQLFRGQHGLDCRILRVANPYGPGQMPNRQQGVVANLIGQGLSGVPFQIWGDGSIARDFIHVDDVANAVRLTSVYDGDETIFNVGSGSATSVATIANDVERVLGLTDHPRVHHQTRGFDVPINYLDTSCIRSEMKWEPTIPWLAGLHDAAIWIANQPGPPHP